MRKTLAELSEKLTESQRQETVSVNNMKRFLFNGLSRMWVTSIIYVLVISTMY